MRTGALFKTLSVKAKLTLSAFCWNMGGIFETDSHNMRTPSFRVDPSVGTDTVKETPFELAANLESTEILNLVAEFVDLPPEIKIKLN